ncbi:amidase [Microbacterium trichothecenolyticum]|uniref:Asp-tRNA(Asn)/Glu-tRNA(Gln) amidotransferase A subunit family amidase n=1 Tax=Microbacterium trichothecenolyticum TaxID=69370 RepID=A0ABU0TX89_MICTR|nr:amidase family protein [Microbacterium trichothecenolyticum]MDQ1124140.1 Asp-tRNA(Asn)/Glu-tRNA(Gln) amidotransferase A subunit family amidase [Microbacterium trichothecenolyticum]
MTSTDSTTTAPADGGTAHASAGRPRLTADEYAWLSATQIAARIADGELTAVEVAEAACARIEQINPALNAYVFFDRAQVLRDAADLDAKQASGAPLGPLHGVPFAIKSLTSVAGLPATHAMKPFAHEIAERDAVVVTRLKDAGGLFTGLTNAPEAGYYGGTDGHLYGPTHNPWKSGHTAGGSSGGSAAAVAAGMVPLAEGADGAGSVRIPAAMCGVVGLKPSLGRIPHSLLPASYETWVFHGPLTRTVADAALMYDVMAGFDPSDPLSLPAEPTPRADAATSVAGWRVAYSPDLHVGYVDPEVARICREAVAAFEELGATVTEATPDWGQPEQAMWEGIWVPGFASDYDVFPDWRAMSGQVDDRLIEIHEQGAALTAVEISRAQVFRSKMYATFTEFMREYDLLVSPTLASAAFPLSQFAPSWLQDAPLRSQLLGWLLTYPYNMLTSPAITVPAGFTQDGRPVGLQIAARHRADGDALAAAAAFESVRPWSAARPAL